MEKFTFRLRWLLAPLTLGLLLMGGLSDCFAQIQIKGTVKGGDTQESLPGVYVVVKGSSKGTITEVNGSYQIEVPNSEAVLVFSYIGYQTTEVVVGKQTTIDVNLATELEALEEIVVVGYGEQTEKEVTTAISKIDSDIIESLPIYRTEQALQGTVPGIVVVQESGSPGAPLTVRIRGMSSANSSNPLYLVDGAIVPDINFLNSEDIDNISILKDAAASAIYGARGGNGVVLVTTKSGRRNSSSPKVSVSGYYGVQSLAENNRPDLMDKNQWLDFYNNSVDYYESRGLTGVPTRGRFTDAERAVLPNTDWYDVMFGDAPIYNVHASVADGKENYSWMLSTGLFSQDGVLGADIDDKNTFKRYSVRGAFEADLIKGLNFNISGSVVRTDREFLFENSAGTGTSIMNFINNLAPIYPAFDGPTGEIFNPGRQSPAPVFTAEDGTQVELPTVGAITNPLLGLLLSNNEAVNNVKTVNTGLTLELGRWKVSTQFSYFGSNALNRSFVPSYNFPTQSLFNDPNRYSESDIVFWRYQWDNVITYTHNLPSGHNFEVLFGTSIIEDELNVSTISGNDFFSNNFDDINFGLIKDLNSTSVSAPFIEENGWRSFFGRLNYSFKDRYLLGVTVRADASSKFGENNRTGIFPSVSVGWNVSEEAFFDNINAFDLLKIRGSWGVNGNDQIPAYQFLTTVSTDANYVFGGGSQTLSDGIYSSILGNPDIKWEQVTQFNIGADANLFNNRLGISFDYFVKKTSDMLIPGVGTPILVGQTAPFRNAADVENRGWEILTTYKDQVNDKLSWNIGFNISAIDNEVTNLGGGEPIPGGFDRPAWEAPISRTDVGQSIASFYGFQVESIDENGELVFRDLDGNEGITVDDKTFIGNPFPDFTYGITGGLEYAGFDLSFFFYGSQGNDIYQAYIRPDATNLNKPAEWAAWTPGSTTIARSNLFGNAPNNAEVSSYYIEDGSFLKLKTLTIGYTLPQSISSKLKASKIRFYITGQNLFVFSNYSGGDPEIGQSGSDSFLDLGIDRGFYPQPRTILGGFQINLF